MTVTIGGHASTIVLVPSITTCPGWQQIVQATLSAIAQTASQPVQPVYAGCLVCQAVTCAACNFTDVAFSADNGYIYEVVAWNLMAGVANQFQPNAPAAYAEIVRATTLLAGPRARTVGIRVSRGNVELAGISGACGLSQNGHAVLEQRVPAAERSCRPANGDVYTRSTREGSMDLRHVPNALV